MSSDWVKLVKKVREDEKCSYKEAMIKAKPLYKKEGGAKAEEKPKKAVKKSKKEVEVVEKKSKKAKKSTVEAV
jgi:hypothetical protein